MKYLVSTFLHTSTDGDLIRLEIYSDNRKFDYYEKVPEGSCRVISYKLDPVGNEFKMIDADVNLQALFDNNRPDPNTWYSDGPHRVNVEMVIKHLKSMY